MDDKHFYVDFNHGQYEVKDKITNECVKSFTNYVEAIEEMNKRNNLSKSLMKV